MDYELLVVGSGPAGQKAAIQAAKLGKRVGIIERQRVVGGVSVNTGTIPSKSLREAVVHLSGYLERNFYGEGYRAKQKISFDDLIDRTRRVIEHETQVIRSQLTRNGVDLLTGVARFIDPHTAELTRPSADGRPGEVERITADTIILAVGTRPARPTGVPFTDGKVVDSDGILALGRIPKVLTVVGAGVVGIEYASMFSVLDVEVTVIEARRQMLDFVDRELVEDLQYQLRDQGVTFRLGEEVAGIAVEGDAIRATLRSGKQVLSDAVLYAAGRQGATAELGLEALGLTADERGRIKVDEHYRTAVGHIFAVGDVIGFPALASTSMEQGRLAACAAFDRECKSLPELFPFGIYTIPEISTVGQTEEQLTAKSIPYEVGLARYREISRGKLLGDERGLLKLIFHRESRQLLGVHAIGTQATELIHVGQAVLAYKGTLEYFIDTVFNYPTLAECYKVAALDARNKLDGRR